MMKANVNKVVVGLLIAVLAVIPVLGACAKPAPPAPPTEPTAPEVQKPSVVKVGFMEDMTSIYAAIGKGHLAGLQAKFAQVNAAGGIDGVPLELEWADCAQDAGLSVAAYKKFKRDGCLIIGALSTLHSNAVTGMATDDKISVVAFAAGTDLYFPPTPYTWSYIGNHASWTICTLVPFYEMWKAQYGDKPLKLGIIFMDHPMVLPTIPCVEEWCRQNNVELVGVEKTPMTAVEYKIEVSRLRDKGADAILLGGNNRWPVVRDMGELGMLPGLEVTQDTKEIIWHDGGVTPLGTQGESFAGGWQVAGEYAKYFITNRFEYGVFADTTGRPELAALKEAEKETFGDLSPLYHAPFVWGWMWELVADAAIKQAVSEVGWENLSSATVSEKGLPNLTVDIGGLGPFPFSTADYPGDRSFVNHEGLARMNESWGHTEVFVPEEQWFNGDKYCWDHGIYEPLMER